MKVIIFLTFLSVFSCSIYPSENIPLSEQQLNNLLNTKDRYPEDSIRDSDRLPSKIMLFSGVAKNHVILDLYAGGGWYTELFSKAVGEIGKVYTHNDSLTWRFGGKELSKRTKENRLANVIRLDNIDLEDIDIPSNNIDIAFMGINYHDLFFTHRTRNGQVEQMRNEIVDYKQALLTIHSSLKKNGVLIITDHVARPGSGYRAANDLHRIDPSIVKFHLSEAGFELVEEAFYLRNPKDDLDALVFDPKVRGKTDRFIYKFKKREIY